MVKLSTLRTKINSFASLSFAMANHEDYLDALTAFGRNSPKEIPPILEQYLTEVAKNGETLFQWPLLKPLIVGKMEQVFEELQQGLGSENITSRPNVENVCFDVMKTRIMDAVDKFTGAPFTVQRLCELLTEPKRHYKRSDKFMRGLEKNVLVVSTVDPFGRKVVSEAGNKHLVNGMDNGSPFLPRDSSISSSLPPVPGWVTTSASTASTTAGAQSSSPKKCEGEESGMSTNGVGSSLVTPMFGDQGDQPPAVHAEEVVETALSVETSDVGPEATGAGEAMAEDEEEMGTEDTSASTSSSSSSSSEDLSNSDPGESLTNVSTPPPTVTSSSSSEITTDTKPMATEEESKPTEQGMELESDQSTPDTSKDPQSEQQDATQTAACQSSGTSACGDADAPSPMDTTTAATSSHTGPPSEQETEGQASESLPEKESSPGRGEVGESSNVEVAEEAANKTVSEEGDGQDISSASSSCTDPESVRSYADVVSGEKPDSDSSQEQADTRDEEKDGDKTEEPSPSATVVTSTGASLSPSHPPPSEGKSVSSSSNQRPPPRTDREDEDGEPHAKHRRLSTDQRSDSPPSSLPPKSSSMQEDSEPSSSSSSAASPPPPSSEDHPSAAGTESSSSAASTSEAVPLTSADKRQQDGTSPDSEPITSASAASSDQAELGGGDGHTSSSSSSAKPESQSSRDGDHGVETCGDMIDSQDKTLPAADSPSHKAEATGDVSSAEPMEQD